MSDGRLQYSSDEMMTVAAARQLRNRMVCFVGIGLPSAAANLARATHAPECVLIYESGAIGAKPTRLPLSIGDGELAETADAVVSLPEIFNYWLQGGRVDVGFLGAAQVDRHGNLNSTVIGSYERPSVRLPGAGGAPEIARSSKEVIVIVRQSRRTFVDKLDFLTSVGGRTSMVITDLAILRPDPVTRELIVSCLHPDVSVEAVKAATGWAVRIAPDVAVTPPPRVEELAALRALSGARP
jgi:glutaconate CoA-transferase, subunit B